MHLEIYEKGRFLRKKNGNDLIIVDYVEITNKSGKFVYKVHDTYGNIHDVKDLFG